MTQDKTPQEARPIMTVDAVIVTIADDTLKVLLHRRPREPFQGSWALPGGYIHVNEDSGTDAAMERILQEKAGVSDIYFEQLATYSGPDRDPRDWSVSVAHIALVQEDLLSLGDDPDVVLTDVDALPPLAFDHENILAEALARIRGKGAYSSLPTAFLPKTFTLAQLHRVYEITLGETIERVSFRRKIMEVGMVEETGQKSTVMSRRPAKLFRMKVGSQTYVRNFATAG
ncbi:NUDIX hydrolase [Pseudosulfitobacter pseudonitzschiae]|uniref:NUDIX hydrolase n=1 Tax=Pseudosulfitobacter pseudonitzschiae TaxID=1402135 RepID=UPI003B79ED9F